MIYSKEHEPTVGAIVLSVSLTKFYGRNWEVENRQAKKLAIGLALETAKDRGLLTYLGRANLAS